MVAYSFQKRFVLPIQVGLGIANAGHEALPPPKRQTIRAVGKRRHARPGEVLQLYTAMRTKQCKLIGVAECISVEGITIRFGSEHEDDVIDLHESGMVISNINDLDVFSWSDGFKSWDDMLKFWSEEHPDVRSFEGVLVRWEQRR